MHAILCHRFGPPSDLIYEEVEPLVAGPGQVVVDVKACGVNFPDLLIVQGKYQFKPPFPFSPGGEVAGVVSSIGKGVQGVEVGSRVVGIGVAGGFADQMLLPAAALVPMPDGMDFQTASAFTLTYATSLYALQDRAQLKAGETVLVLGAAGGVGLASIDVAKALGARVIAAASTEAKLEQCRLAGADETILYSEEDLKKRAKALTGGGGVDVVVDPVGGDFAEQALRAIGWEGRFLVIGFASGEIPRIPLNLMLLKGCQVIGVFWGSMIAREPKRSAEHHRQLREWFADGTCTPFVSKTYPLSEAAQALEDLEARRVIGKVVLLP